MMTSDSLINDDWPDLHTTTTNTNHTKQSLTTTNNNIDHSDDWEVLNDDTTNISISQNGSNHNTTTTSTTTTDFVVVHYDVHDPTCMIQSERSSPINRKMLHHSVSSPILSGAIGTSNDINHNIDDAVVIGADDSFTLVSDVASVWTQSTVGNHTTTTTTTTIKTVSFRDAILLSPTKIQTQQNAAIQQQYIPPKQRSRIQPRFVVVPSPSKHMNIQRCTKSTGDLQKLGHIMSLSESDRTNNVSYNSEYIDNEESDSCSSNSSNHDHTYDDEFYYRKAIGCASHMNGLKLRPDEAKRKNMILYKKNQQRQQQQATKRN